MATDLGTFRFEFAADKAPKHVEQFLTLARQGYYDGSAFFRVVANGIIQGGDPLLKDPKTPRNLWGTGRPQPAARRNQQPETRARRGFHRRAFPISPIAMARSSSCASYPQPTLDGQYSAFGRVTEGMDVVERISQAPVGADGMTETPVRILKVTIEKKKVEPFLNATPDEMRKTVTLKTTLGSIKIQMEPDWAPESRAQFPEAGVHGLVQRHRVSPPGERLRGAGRHGQYARRQSRAPRRPLGASAQGRVPRRHQARSRHRLHGAHATIRIPPPPASS